MTRLYPSLGAWRGGVEKALGRGIGVGPGREGVQAEDGEGPAVDGQRDDQHSDDVEQESRPSLVGGEPVQLSRY